MNSLKNGKKHSIFGLRLSLKPSKLRFRRADFDSAILEFEFLPPQPASVVSSGHFRILGKHAALPPLTGVAIGLRDPKARLV